MGDFMDRRKFLKNMGILAGMGMVSASMIDGRPVKYLIKKSFEDGKYDFDDLLIDNYDELRFGAVEYKTKIKYKSSNRESERNSYGLGFRKGNKLLTANHLVSVDNLIMRTPFGMMYLPAETLSSHVYFPDGEGKILHKDKKEDIALIEMPDEYGNEFPLGNSDELEIGNLIALSGKSLGQKKVVKQGRVISTYSSDEMRETGGYGKKEDRLLVWYLNMSGDSGGPVYAFRDGEPEVVGMCVTMTNGLGEEVKINHMKDILKKYL